MALKLKTNRKAQWVEVLEDNSKPKSKKNPVLGMFKFQPLTQSESFAIFKECETDKWYIPPTTGKKTSNPYRESAIEDPIELILKRAKKIIVDWKDIFSEDEEGNEFEVEFSKDMIDVLYDFNPSIINHVLDKADELANIASKSDENELKN